MNKFAAPDNVTFFRKTHMNKLSALLILSLLLPALVHSQSKQYDFDIIIKNGTIYDGTGADPIQADVGIKKDRIAAVGTRKVKTNNKDFPEYMAPTAVICLSIIDWARFILLHLGSGENAGVALDTDTLRTLHSPPDSATWRTGAEEKGYGIPSLNFALGWYTLNIDNKEGLLWHPGGNTGFIAQVVVDPERKNAVLVVTNVRTSHNHLFKAMNKIREQYSPIADLPGINSQ